MERLRREMRKKEIGERREEWREKVFSSSAMRQGWKEGNFYHPRE